MFLFHYSFLFHPWCTVSRYACRVFLKFFSEICRIKKHLLTEVTQTHFTAVQSSADDARQRWQLENPQQNVKIKHNSLNMYWILEKNDSREMQPRTCENMSHCGNLFRLWSCNASASVYWYEIFMWWEREQSKQRGKRKQKAEQVRNLPQQYWHHYAPGIPFHHGACLPTFTATTAQDS